MCVSIVAWRAAIGIFNFCSKSSDIKKYFIPRNLFCSKHDILLLQGRRKWACFLKETKGRISFHCMNIVGLSLIIQMLLLCSGIHPNPGPQQDNTYCDVSICHANIRSLKHRDNQTLSKLDHNKCNLVGKFSIITLSETWLTANDSDKDYQLQGYQMPFRRDREPINGPTGYGGILAYISNDLACKRRLDLELPNIEAMWLEVRSANNKFFLCVAYRRPNFNEFWNVLQENVNLVNETHTGKIFIAGDLNADPNSTEGTKMSEFVYANRLCTHINEPTRVTENSQSILDQFISNIPYAVKSVNVSPPVSTNDHCTIEAKLLFRQQRARPYVRIMWNFKNADFDLCREDIANTNWDDCFAEDNIDLAVDLWTSKLMKIARETIPHKVVTIRPHDKPWYTTDLRRLCRRKNRLYHKAKEQGTEEAWGQYRAVRNEYFSKISEAKESHDKEKYKFLINEKNSSKEWWKVIKEILKASTQPDSIPPIEVDGNIITDDKEKASAFNNFFLESSFLDDSKATLPDEAFLFHGRLDSIDITLNDVLDQLSCLDITKAYGPDEISPRFLKEGGPVLAETILKLYRLSLRTSRVPCLWKKANVIPIHKKDKQCLRSNYRPVSLLSIVGKMLERIVYKYVYNYFKENFIISLFQSGFLPGMSTVTQLIEVYHYFCKSVDEGKEIRVCFLDISKAFDRVWQKALIFKLKKCGIHGRLLEWFEDYLRDRMQRVVINGQASDWGAVTAGVPQGSVLGPLLFLIFINDIVHAVSHCHIRLFADDTCLFIEVDNRDGTARKINDDLKSIHTWSKQWLIEFSVPKTKSLTISNKKDAINNPILMFKGQPIEEVNSHMYLGLRFSNNLRWKAHINDVSLKARKKLNFMSPLKMKVDRRSLEIMYRSFVQPSMEYAIVVWGGSYDCDIMKLESIHLDAMRLIVGATARSNIVNVREEMGGSTIQQRINDMSIVTLFKIINGIAPPYLTSIFDDLSGNRNYTLRNSNIRIPKCRLETFKKSFFPRSISLWNRLPEEARSMNSVELLKLKLHPELNDLLPLYYYGNRWPAVHHARMRIGCSKLNSDLHFNLHVVDNPSCPCGHNLENAEHFLLNCTLYNNEREIMLRTVEEHMISNVNNLLFGNLEYSLDSNKIVFLAVHQFIVNSKRFD